MNTASPEASDTRGASLISRFLDEAVLFRICYYPRTREAARYVLETVPEMVTLERVADIAGMSSSAFSRYFAEKTGVTFSTFVKTMRIERVLPRIEARDCSITHLAHAAGYGLNAFTRAFKDVTGHTPTTYRRLHLLGAERSRDRAQEIRSI